MKRNVFDPAFGPLGSALALWAVLGGLSLPASGAFEKWTNKDGKSVSMEFVKLTEQDGEKAAEFKMLNGKLVTVKLATLAEADAQRLSDGPSTTEPVNPVVPVAADSALYDAALKKIRAGQELSAEEREKCNKAFAACFEQLCVKNETETYLAFSEKDRTDYFINAVKMAIIAPELHGGWPTRSDLRLVVLSGLKKRLEAGYDPFVAFCTIFPALDAGDQDYAGKAERILMRMDFFLADLASKWLASYWLDDTKDVTKLEPFMKITGLRFAPKNKDGKVAPQMAHAAEIQAFTKQGDTETAQDHNPEALAAYQKALDLSDKAAYPQQWTDAAMNVARTQDKLKDWKKSEALYPEILRLREEHYGKRALETGITLNNYAQILSNMERFKEAEPLMRRALTITEDALGKDDPDVARRLNNLGVLLHKTRRYEEAEPLTRRALDIDEAYFGKNHPAVAKRVVDLALMYYTTDRFKEAEPLVRRSVEIYAASLAATGTKDPQMDSTINIYVTILMKLGDTQEQAKKKIRQIVDAAAKK